MKLLKPLFSGYTSIHHILLMQAWLLH